jgi:hypothetical protein
VFYVYIFDTQMGPGFIKICTYFPYPVKAWVFSELFKIAKVGMAAAVMSASCFGW